MKIRNHIVLAAFAATAISCISATEDLLEREFSEAEKTLATKTVGSVEGEYQDGCLLLYLDEQTTARIENGQMEAVAQELFDGLKTISFEPALSHKPKNEELARELGLHRWFAVTFDESIPVRRFAESEKRFDEYAKYLRIRGRKAGGCAGKRKGRNGAAHTRSAEGGDSPLGGEGSACKRNRKADDYFLQSVHACAGFGDLDREAD